MSFRIISLSCAKSSQLIEGFQSNYFLFRINRCFNSIWVKYFQFYINFCIFSAKSLKTSINNGFFSQSLCIRCFSRILLVISSAFYSILINFVQLYCHKKFIANFKSCFIHWKMFINSLLNKLSLERLLNKVAIAHWRWICAKKRKCLPMAKIEWIL